MMLLHHKSLTLERWQRLSLCERLANVGSEVNRAIAWRARNPHFAQLAFERALELLDLTLLTLPGQESRLRELTRAREALVDYFAGANQYRSSDASWRTYFDAFAHLSRRTQTPA